MTWIRCPSSRSVTRRRASSGPILTRCPARSATPLTSTFRSTSITVPPGRAPALAGAGAAGGGPAGLAPRIFSVARSSASRLDGHGLDQLAADEHVHGELIGPHVRELPGPAGPILIRCTAGSTPSTPLAEITVSNSTAPPTGRRAAPVPAAGRRLRRWLRDRDGQDRFWLGAWPEQAGGRGHVERLVRPGVVVGVHPGGDRRLRRGQVGERPGHIEQLAAQRLVPALHLPGRGR